MKAILLATVAAIAVQPLVLFAWLFLPALIAGDTVPPKDLVGMSLFSAFARIAICRRCWHSCILTSSLLQALVVVVSWHNRFGRCSMSSSRLRLVRIRRLFIWRQLVRYAGRVRYQRPKNFLWLAQLRTKCCVFRATWLRRRGGFLHRLASLVRP